MTTRPGREADAFMLRLPPGMRDRIKMEADRNGRSMNAEVVAALSQYFPEPPDPFETLIQDVLEVLSQPDLSSATGDERHEAPVKDADPLADLLERVRQEVERRRS